MTSGQALSLASLQSALSEERLQAYVVKGDRDPHEAVARYFWNVALVASLQPALHALEVTVRNHLYAASLKVVDQTKVRLGEIPCWLDTDPSLLEPAEVRAVQEAKDLLRGKRPMTPGRLIGKLSFGFWVSLCKRPYEQGRQSGPALWPGLATAGFPFMKRELRTRSTIFHRLDELRELRNRVSHHEPIWDRPLPERHSQIIEAIGWINQGVAKAVTSLSSFPGVHAAGHVAFRDRAVATVRIPEV